MSFFWGEVLFVVFDLCSFMASFFGGVRGSESGVRFPFGFSFGLGFGVCVVNSFFLLSGGVAHVFWLKRVVELEWCF